MMLSRAVQVHSHVAHLRLQESIRWLQQGGIYTSDCKFKCAEIVMFYFYNEN